MHRRFRTAIVRAAGSDRRGGATRRQHRWQSGRVHLVVVRVRPLTVESTLLFLLPVLAVVVLWWWEVLQPLVLGPPVLVPLLLLPPLQRICRVGWQAGPYEPFAMPAERPLRNVQCLPRVVPRERLRRVAAQPARVLVPARLRGRWWRRLNRVRTRRRRWRLAVLR